MRGVDRFIVRSQTNMTGWAAPKPICVVVTDSDVALAVELNGGVGVGVRGDRGGYRVTHPRGDAVRFACTVHPKRSRAAKPKGVKHE